MFQASTTEIGHRFTWIFFDGILLCQIHQKRRYQNSVVLSVFTEVFFAETSPFVTDCGCKTKLSKIFLVIFDTPISTYWRKGENKVTYSRCNLGVVLFVLSANPCLKGSLKHSTGKKIIVHLFGCERVGVSNLVSVSLLEMFNVSNLRQKSLWFEPRSRIFAPP